MSAPAGPQPRAGTWKPSWTGLPTRPIGWIAVPAFWLLVPGALGLVGVADVLGGDAGGTNSLVATIATMVAIALGVLAGSVVSNRMQRPPL